MLMCTKKFIFLAHTNKNNITQKKKNLNNIDIHTNNYNGGNHHGY